LYVVFQAVGASVRMFELMDRLPTINMEGGQTLPSVNQRKLQLHLFCGLHFLPVLQAST